LPTDLPLRPVLPCAARTNIRASRYGLAPTRAPRGRRAPRRANLKRPTDYVTKWKMPCKPLPSAEIAIFSGLACGTVFSWQAQPASGRLGRRTGERAGGQTSGGTGSDRARPKISRIEERSMRQQSLRVVPVFCTFFIHDPSSYRSKGLRACPWLCVTSPQITRLDTQSADVQTA